MLCIIQLFLLLQLLSRNCSSPFNINKEMLFTKLILINLLSVVSGSSLSLLSLSSSLLLLLSLSFLFPFLFPLFLFLLLLLLLLLLLSSSSFHVSSFKPEVKSSLGDGGVSYFVGTVIRSGSRIFRVLCSVRRFFVLCALFVHISWSGNFLQVICKLCFCSIC